MAQGQKSVNGTGSARLRKPSVIEREQQNQQRDRDRQLELDRGRPRDRPGTPGSTHRSSFSSSPDRDRPIAPARQTPKPGRSPFKSFRARLQAFGFGSDATPPSSPVLPSSAANGSHTPQRSGSLGRKSSRKDGQQSVRGKKVSGPIAVVPGGAARLKGYSGPAGSRKNAALAPQATETAAGGIGKSASLPANLAGVHSNRNTYGQAGDDPGDDEDEHQVELDRKEAETFPPTLLWRSDEDVSEFGMRETRSPLSVDEYLASHVPAHSPPLVTAVYPSAPSGRRSPRPPIHISPRPDTLSPNPPASITRFLRSPTPDQQNQLSPVMPQLVNRVSADFVRQVDEPPLSALRARQAAETEALRAANRYSRLLPGATLPSDFSSQALVRSKTEGAVPERWRPHSAADLDSVRGSPAQINGGDAPSTPPAGPATLRRSLSDSPMLPQSDVMLNAIAASTSNHASEDTRGFSLGRVAGRRKSSHNRAVSVPTTRTEHSGYDSPMKPFPSEFEEVPMQSQHRFRAPDSSISPSTPATPLMPQIVETSPSRTDSSVARALPLAGMMARNHHEHAPSPLLDMIEHLEAHPYEEEPSPRTVPGSFTRAGHVDAAAVRQHHLARQVAQESDAMEFLDETPLDFDQRGRNQSTQSSIAGGHPFPLAAYLDGTTPSRQESVASPSGVQPGPPGYLLQHGADAIAPSSPVRSHSNPKSPDSLSEYDPSPARSPFALGAPAEPRSRAPDSPERSITMEQMEREIAQMEIELAAAGTPRSLYESPFLSSVRSPVEPESPTPSGSKVTPRTNKRWSLIEMEKAYERMKDLLAASSERRPSEREEDGRSPALQAVPEGASPAEGAVEQRQTTSQEASRGASPRLMSVSPAKSVHLEAKSPSLRERRNLQKKEVPLGQSGGPLTIVADKPLPGLPLPTPSPARKPVPPYDRPASEEPVKSRTRSPSPVADLALAEHVDSPAKDQSPRTPASRESVQRTPSPPSSPPRAASPEAESVREPDATDRETEPQPSTDAAATEPSTSEATLAHRRTGSEGGIRQLYLPLRNKSTRDSMASFAGLDEMLSELGSPVTEGPLAGSSLTTPPPASPARDHRLPTSARSSRFSRYELRSGAGREMQRRLGNDDAIVAVEPLSPMRRAPLSRRSSGRASHKREKLDTGSKRTGSPKSPTEDATTWYRMSPGRAKERRLSGEVGQGGLRTSGGSQHRASLPRPVLTATQVRTMDKLEIYLEYITIRADLEKAELERAALFDALRETRATLADVRKQRDASERELSLLRSAPEPSPTGSDASTNAWRERAQQALFDVEILRHELLESKAREAALRRPSTASNGITTTLGLGAAHLASSNDSSTSEPSRTATITPAQIPFPTLPMTTGSPTLVMHDAPDLGSRGPAERPASAQAAIHREPKDSFASTFDSDASSRLSMVGLDFASPIMGQTIPGGGRGAKSSFGSEASPLKRHAVSPVMMGRSFSALGFPGAGKAVEAPRLAKTSMGTIATDSEQADRSFESTFVDGALRQRDADFLSDLTANAADLSPEDKRGQRTFAGSPLY